MAHVTEDLSRKSGFTLVEIIIVLTVAGILCAVAIPAISSYYGECCVKSVMFELAAMIKEAKVKALEGEEQAIVFKPDEGKFSLLSDRGPDNRWKSDDDVVVRTVYLATKGGGLMFGYGTYGPVKDPDPLAATDDGVTFDDNTLVCNTRLTGNAGTVYIKASSGAAMALTMNSTDFGYALRRWNGKKWMKL